MIGKWYDFICFELLQMSEHFTDWFKRISKAHPLFFWGTIGTICFVLLGLVGFMSWFIVHILQYEVKKSVRYHLK